MYATRIRLIRSLPIKGLSRKLLLDLAHRIARRCADPQVKQLSGSERDAIIDVLYLLASHQLFLPFLEILSVVCARFPSYKKFHMMRRIMLSKYLDVTGNHQLLLSQQKQDQNGVRMLHSQDEDFLSNTLYLSSLSGSLPGAFLDALPGLLQQPDHPRARKKR